jgi:hypothetical protein
MSTSNAVSIRCHTNLDLNIEHWPAELPCRPMIGDYIISHSGLELEVCRVTFVEVNSHKLPPECEAPSYYDKDDYVLCKVELHLPKHRFENITSFEQWYRNRDQRRN